MPRQDLAPWQVEGDTPTHLLAQSRLAQTLPFYTAPDQPARSLKRQRLGKAWSDAILVCLLLLRLDPPALLLLLGAAASVSAASTSTSSSKIMSTIVDYQDVHTPRVRVAWRSYYVVTQIPSIRRTGQTPTLFLWIMYIDGLHELLNTISQQAFATLIQVLSRCVANSILERVLASH